MQAARHCWPHKTCIMWPKARSQYKFYGNLITRILGTLEPIYIVDPRAHNFCYLLKCAICLCPLPNTKAIPSVPFPLSTLSSTFYSQHMTKLDLSLNRQRSCNLVPPTAQLVTQCPQEEINNIWFSLKKDQRKNKQTTTTKKYQRKKATTKNTVLIAQISEFHCFLTNHIRYLFAPLLVLYSKGPHPSSRPNSHCTKSQHFSDSMLALPTLGN